MEISREELKNIIRTAFQRGEDWGITYSTWFTPTEEQTEEKIQEVFNEFL